MLSGFQTERERYKENRITVKSGLFGHFASLLNSAISLLQLIIYISKDNYNFFVNWRKEECCQTFAKKAAVEAKHHKRVTKRMERD